MVRADLFFDLDRTLWDFDRNSREALQEIFVELAQPNLPEHREVDTFISVYEVENEKCWKAYREGRLTQQELRPLRFRRAMEELGLSPFDGMDSMAEALGEAYVQRAPYRTALIDGAIEVCRTLKARGHRMFILTNGFEEVQHIKMANSGLAPFFDSVFTSDALGYKKPRKEAFDRSLKLADSEVRKAIMIGDDLECDVHGARLAGWKQVHYDASDAPTQPQIWRRVRGLNELLDLDLNTANGSGN